MSYNLYFHDDFDGVSSGAVLLNFLRSQNETIGSYTPVQFSPSLKSKWAEVQLQSPSILVDFLYHPNASWWFDHHQTSFIHPEWQEAFVEGEKTHYDPTSKSCCGMVLQHLKTHFNYNPPQHIQELADYADMIDSASYPNVKYFLEMEHPSVQLATALSRSKNMQEFFITQLAEGSMERLADSSNVKEITEQAKKELEEIKRIFPTIASLRNNIVVVDTSLVETKVPRFLEFLTYPDAKYSIVVRSHPDNFSITVGANPWSNKQNPISLGELLAPYGGGGHHNAAGAERGTKEETMRMVEEIASYLETHGTT